MVSSIQSSNGLDRYCAAFSTTVTSGQQMFTSARTEGHKSTLEVDDQVNTMIRTIETHLIYTGMIWLERLQFKDIISFVVLSILTNVLPDLNSQ